MRHHDRHHDLMDSDDSERPRHQGGRAGVRSSRQKEDGLRRDPGDAPEPPGGAHGRRTDVSSGLPSGAPAQRHGEAGRPTRR